MEKEIAKIFYDDLLRHPSILTPEKDCLYRAVMDTQLPRQKLYSELPPNLDSCIESGQLYFIKMDRIFNKDIFLKKSVVPLKNWYREYSLFNDIFGIYHLPNVLVEMSISDTVKNVVKNSPHPYFMQGTQIILYEPYKRFSKTEKRPVLVIPGCSEEYMHKILDWEKSQKKSR